MKAKLNLDTAKIKGFAIQHTEKVVFGIFALVLLYFAYSGFLHETFEKSPSELSTLITSARNHITTSDPPAVVNETAVPVIDIEQNLKPRELTAFATKELVRPNIRDLGSKRGNPVIFPPTGLHVSAGRGTVKLKDPPKKPRPANANEEVEAPADTRGITWAVITGIVSLDEQIDEYNEAFAAAIEERSADDEPSYVFHQIQRQEIAADGTAGPWQDVSTSGIAKKIATWASGNQRDEGTMVASKHIRREVCLPLLPQIGHDFGEEVVHPDLIIREEEPEEEPEEVKSDPVLEIEDRPDLPPGEDIKKKVVVKQKAEEDTLKKLLFRMFDVTALPGKIYRYRGRVWVRNPNYKVEVRHLAEQEFVFEGQNFVTNQEPYLKSSWGPASPAVTIPFFSSIFAGEFVDGGSREDSMNMPVAVLEPRTGYELLDTIPIHRGQFANFKEGNPLVIKPSSRRDSGTRIEDTPLNSDQFVFDFLPSDSSGEHHAVVMGPDLKLRVVHESKELVARIAELDALNSDEPSASDDDASDDPFGNIQLKPGRRRN